MYFNFEALGPTLNEWNVLIFLLFYNDLDLYNQKILWLPSIFQFERTVHNLDHPSMYVWIWICMHHEKGSLQIYKDRHYSHRRCQHCPGLAPLVGKGDETFKSKKRKRNKNKLIFFFLWKVGSIADERMSSLVESLRKGSYNLQMIKIILDLF